MVMKKRLLDIHRESDDQLDVIHRKVSDASVLNGGFDRLMFKIDRIEAGQEQLVSKVDKIHDAIYDPAEGLFAKMSEHKLSSTMKINEVQQHVASLTEWKSAKEDSEAQSVKTHDEYDERLEKVKQDLGILQADRAFVVSFLKWVGVAIGGGIVTILIGLIQSKLNIK
jgi:hypothetical protein